MVGPRMDVRCERCKTDYEFDDGRITEAGVTVKCTTCGHVFKVKKKALVVTVPVKPDDGQMSVSPASSVSAPPAGTGAFIPGPGDRSTSKEWKVRQANGNVFTFKELTTLQKWIVERKVTREDEISLTGESWKRLGNIAELASFFQVVDEAQRAQQLAALQSAGAMGYLPPGATPSGGYAIPSGDAVSAAQLANFPGPAAFPRPGSNPLLNQVLQPGMQSAAMSASAFPPLQGHGPQAPQVNVTVHNPITQPAPVPLTMPAPAGAPSPAFSAAITQEDLAAARIKGGGGAGKVLVALLVLAVLGGGGYLGYTQYWVPRQEAIEREAQGKVEAEKKAAEAKRAAEEAAAAEAKEKARKAAAEEAARAAAAAATPDAGTDGTVTASAKVPRDFDGWMAQGDRMLEREKAEQALAAYGRAADLNPERAEPHSGRGRALLDMGQRLQAEAAFLQALKLNPRYGEALMGLAETYRNQGKNDEAKKYYEQYLDVLPSGPEAAVARQALQRLQQ